MLRGGALLTLWLCCAPALAQPAPDDPAPQPAADPSAVPPSPGLDERADRAARNLFEDGRIAFAAARFGEALQYFRAAHRISERPILLFNIGSTLDRLRQDAEALE